MSLDIRQLLEKPWLEPRRAELWLMLDDGFTPFPNIESMVFSIESQVSRTWQGHLACWSRSYDSDLVRRLSLVSTLWVRAYIPGLGWYDILAQADGDSRVEEATIDGVPELVAGLRDGSVMMGRLSFSISLRIMRLLRPHEFNYRS